MVTILLAVYNGEEYIKESICSVFNQTYIKWELVIIDNGSTDNTVKIVENLIQNEQRAVLYQLAQKGKCLAYNFGFEHSNGDYICFLAADDILTSNSLELRHSTLEGSKNSYTTCLLKTISDNSKYDSIIFPKNINIPNYSGGSIFFSRFLAKKIFPLPINLPNEDTWSSISLKSFGNNIHIPEVLYIYRIHDSNSFGYETDFNSKKVKYLERMEAYKIFRNKWQSLDNKKLSNFIDLFIKGIDYCNKNNILKLIFLVKLPIKERLVFIYYSSPLLYKIRNKYFKYFSGLFN
jgi:glycosyltransferase involved in cell wall biosynthesis